MQNSQIFQIFPSAINHPKSISVKFIGSMQRLCNDEDTFIRKQLRIEYWCYLATPPERARRQCASKSSSKRPLATSPIAKFCKRWLHTCRIFSLCVNRCIVIVLYEWSVQLWSAMGTSKRVSCLQSDTYSSVTVIKNKKDLNSTRYRQNIKNIHLSPMLLFAAYQLQLYLSYLCEQKITISSKLRCSTIGTLER